MYLPMMYCIKAVVCRLYEMLYPCSCNVVISCWKSGAYDIVICRGGTDMCFVPGSGWKHLDLEQYRISGLRMPPPSYLRRINWWIPSGETHRRDPGSRRHRESLLYRLIPRRGSV